MNEKIDYHKNHRKRMRNRFELQECMFTISFPHEVLEMALFLIYARQNTNVTAHLIINAFKSIGNAVHAPVEKLAEVENVGLTAAKKIRIYGALFDHLSETVPPAIDFRNDM